MTLEHSPNLPAKLILPNGRELDVTLTNINSSIEDYKQKLIDVNRVEYSVPVHKTTTTYTLEEVKYE